MLCPSCRQTNPDDNRFCGTCGMPLKAEGNLRSQAQSTVDYFYRVAREHPEGERPENPVSPEATYDTDTPPKDDFSRQDAELREKEHARNVAAYRDLRPDPSALPQSTEGKEKEERKAPRITHLSPELIEYDRQVPLIAEPGTDRRRPRPEWHFRDRRAPSPQKTSSSDSTPPNVVAFTPSSEETQELKVPQAVKNDVQTKPSFTSPKIESVPRFATQVQTAPLEHGFATNFFDISERSRNSRNSLHGPSFLGLDSDSDVEYVDEDEHASHIRRNLALVILVILLALGAVQWRAIRDFGMRYAGTMHLPGRKIAAASPAENSQNAPSTASPGATTTPAGNGQPEIVTEPVRNPNAAQNSGAQSPNSTADAASGSASNDSGTQPASSAKPGDNNTIASKGDNSRLPQGEPADDGADKSDSGKPDNDVPAATPDVSTRKAQPAETSRPDPGQAELAQASAALDPASQVSWLWKAVGKGSADAQLRLADLYLDGRGVPQNCEQALVLLKSASNKNYSRARIRLGSLYAAGKCVPQDRVAAYHWMSLALDSSPGSQWVEENRQMLWSQMSEEERRRAGGKM